MQPFLRAEVPDELPAGVVLADVRWYLDGRSGRQAYESGHLPGAVFVDLDHWLADHQDPAAGRHPLPSPEHFTAGLAALGIGDDDQVVAYDDADGVVAARLVWMLRATGRAAAVLEGGLRAWRGPLSTQHEHRGATDPQVRPWPVAQLAGVEDAAKAVTGAVLLLDARDAERFTGAVEPVDPRAGHVPGAVNHPVREDVVDGQLVGVEELTARLARDGVRDDVDVVVSCGSGVTACFLLLELEHVGRSGRLWPGSFSQWARDPARSVASGD